MSKQTYVSRRVDLEAVLMSVPQSRKQLAEKNISILARIYGVLSEKEAVRQACSVKALLNDAVLNRHRAEVVMEYNRQYRDLLRYARLLKEQHDQKQ